MRDAWWLTPVRIATIGTAAPLGALSGARCRRTAIGLTLPAFVPVIAGMTVASITPIPATLPGTAGTAAATVRSFGAIETALRVVARRIGSRIGRG